MVLFFDESNCGEAIKRLRRSCTESKLNYVCMNCEWNHSTDRHKVALFTLLHENQCILLRLCKLNLTSGIPNELKEFLLDPEIIKFGVGIEQDCYYLRVDYEIIVHSTLELGDLGNVCGIKNKRLEGMFYNITGRTISIAMQKSDWESNELNQFQIDYATMQVKAGWDVFMHFRSMMNNNDQFIRSFAILSVI